MNEIVCATRGGEGSRAVQMAAIDQARETGNPLVFFYVVNLDRLGLIENGMEMAVHEEMMWLGKALLQVAHARARAQGLDARLVVRSGDVRDEICSYLIAHHASLLLLGAPRAATNTVFGDDPVERFASSIHDTTGVPVLVVRPELASEASYTMWEDTRTNEEV